MAWNFKVLMSERAKRSLKSLLDVTQMACFHFGQNGISSQRDQQPFGTIIQTAFDTTHLPSPHY
jgi:hypothetical protein